MDLQLRTDYDLYRPSRQVTVLKKNLWSWPEISIHLGTTMQLWRRQSEVCRGMQKEIPVKITQRAVLSHVSAVFDPLGIVSSFTKRMRLLLKSIWMENGQSWDKEVNEKNRHEFKKCASEMIRVNQSVLKRTYFGTGVNKVDLHIFSDASFEAICMSAFLRKQDNDKVTFVIGKCRVAPVRNMTVAMLEMQPGSFWSEAAKTYFERTWYWNRLNRTLDKLNHRPTMASFS